VKKTHGTLYDTTMERMKNLRDLGYTVSYVWGKAFETWKKGPRTEEMPLLSMP